MAVTELDDGPARLLGPDSSSRSPSLTLHDAVVLCPNHKVRGIVTKACNGKRIPLSGLLFEVEDGTS